MQIVSSGDNLHKVSDPISGKNNKNINSLSSAEFAHSMVSVNLLTLFLFLLKNLG